MKISHRQIRFILRILHCLGIFFGSFVFIYELFIQRSIVHTICYVCYLLATSAVLYLLFARERPSRKFAYGTFYAICFVTVLFFLTYIYESSTVVSGMTRELIDHVEQDTEINPSLAVMIKISKCCSIDDARHTNETFESFQTKYLDTCGRIEFNEAKPCLPFIRNQRNLTIFLCCTMIVARLLVLTLLWKYVKGEYSGNDDETMSYSDVNGESSTAHFTA